MAKDDADAQRETNCACQQKEGAPHFESHRDRMTEQLERATDDKRCDRG